MEASSFQKFILGTLWFSKKKTLCLWVAFSVLKESLEKGSFI